MVYDGQPITALALKLAPLVFVRPGELRGAEWLEFDLANAEWRIPAVRMKMAEQAHRPFVASGTGDIERVEAARWQQPVRFSVAAEPQTADVR
jgi:integrase